MDNELKKELPFDLYGRYAIIRDIIDTNRKGGEKFKVLDVGGRGNLLQKFLSNDDVFFLDPLVDSNEPNFIKGDGCRMPLKEESFDWVTSADVFEHIPDKKRRSFIKENTRVAKFGVILAAPFFSEEVKQAEINANENYKLFSKGKDHIWLKEHIENGLPREDEIESLIQNIGLDFQKLYNNRLFLWEIIIGINFFVWDNFTDEMKKELEGFNYFYNSEVFPYDSTNPSYRKVYFIKKDKSLKNIKIENKRIDDILFLKTIKKSIDLIAKINNVNKTALQVMEQKIQQKDREIITLNQIVQEKSPEIAHLYQSAKQKDQEISFIKSSKFWKMRESYIRIKNKLRR
jgi:O-antigen biosynthesis protein